MTLEPLQPKHADKMFALLNDERLYKHIGDGLISDVEQFRNRYRRLAEGVSADGREQWVNWIMKLNGSCAGYVQATISDTSAYIAWMVGTRYQGRGLATQAARELIRWIRQRHEVPILARIDDANIASRKVAIRVGMIETSEFEEGERVWVYSTVPNETNQGDDIVAAGIQ